MEKRERKFYSEEFKELALAAYYIIAKTKSTIFKIELYKKNYFSSPSPTHTHPASKH